MCTYYTDFFVMRVGLVGIVDWFANDFNQFVGIIQFQVNYYTF